VRLGCLVVIEGEEAESASQKRRQIKEEIFRYGGLAHMHTVPGVICLCCLCPGTGFGGCVAAAPLRPLIRSDCLTVDYLKAAHHELVTRLNPIEELADTLVSFRLQSSRST
jgi:hypothetical protein